MHNREVKYLRRLENSSKMAYKKGLPGIASNRAPHPDVAQF
jgi:hypothetical protein